MYPDVAKASPTHAIKNRTSCHHYLFGPVVVLDQNFYDTYVEQYFQEEGNFVLNYI